MSASPKLWLVGMTAQGNEENLREMIAPIVEWLDGVIFTFHNPVNGDKGAEYLESVKGDGKVIYRDWVWRHDYSANETLFAGLIQEGDLVITCDTLERPAAKFVSRIKTDILALMNEASLDCLYYYGKAFVFRYNEGMRFAGSPHWMLQGVQNAVEMSGLYPDEREVRLNVRPIKRPSRFHFVGHYLGYYVSYPPGSNHCLLGLEKNGNPQNLFAPREIRRLEFRRLLRSKGIPLTVDGVKGLMKKELDTEIKEYFNSEKILNDAYRYLQLGREDFADDHDWKNMITIP